VFVRVVCTADFRTATEFQTVRNACGFYTASHNVFGGVSFVFTIYE
jgi:hypothetical protein